MRYFRAGTCRPTRTPRMRREKYPNFKNGVSCPRETVSMDLVMLEKAWYGVGPGGRQIRDLGMMPLSCLKREDLSWKFQQIPSALVLLFLYHDDIVSHVQESISMLGIFCILQGYVSRLILRPKR